MRQCGFCARLNQFMDIRPLRALATRASSRNRSAASVACMDDDTLEALFYFGGPPPAPPDLTPAQAASVLAGCGLLIVLSFGVLYCLCVRFARIPPGSPPRRLDTRAGHKVARSTLPTHLVVMQPDGDYALAARRGGDLKRAASVPAYHPDQ